MTQVKSAQEERQKVALRKRAETPSLARRRAAFAAQMREMALTDLENVSARLKSLHKEWERKDGRTWTQLELAEAMRIPYRTFQSWENGEVENSDGKGYDKFARFYSRKLGRKITRHWILFGDTQPVAETPKSKAPVGGLSAPPSESDLAAEVRQLRQVVEELAAQQVRFFGAQARAAAGEADSPSSEEPPAQTQ